MSGVLEFVPKRQTLYYEMLNPMRLHHFLEEMLKWQAYMGEYGAAVEKTVIETDVIISPCKFPPAPRDRRPVKTVIQAGAEKEMLLHNHDISVTLDDFFIMAAEAQAHVNLYKEFVSYIRLQYAVVITCPDDIESFTEKYGTE
jgi:hypothetical protein